MARDRILLDRPESDWPETSTLTGLLAERQKLVVLGDPGFGKSTITSCISSRMCAGGAGIPIPVIVRELKLKADLTWESLLDSLLQHRICRFLGDRATVESLLRDPTTVVLLDGLDEIANLSIRKKLRDAVHVGMSAFPHVKWLLTSRIVGYDKVPFHLMEEDLEPKPQRRRQRQPPKENRVADICYIAPFSGNQIKTFANKWYERHEADQELANERASAFLDAINENAGTKRLARVPYLLTLMALIHRKAASLPHGRTDLYDRITTAYLDSIDVRRNLDQIPYSLSQKKRWLAEAGYQLQLRRTDKKKAEPDELGDVLAREEEVCEWLCKAMTESGADAPEEEAGLARTLGRVGGLAKACASGVDAIEKFRVAEHSGITRSDGDGEQRSCAAG